MELMCKCLIWFVIGMAGTYIVHSWLVVIKLKLALDAEKADRIKYENSKK